MTDNALHVKTKTLDIGLLGLGTVGGGVYKLLERIPNIAIRHIAVREIAKARSIPHISSEHLTTDVNRVIENPEIQLIVEVMGGVDQAYQAIRKALGAGKHVVTANKVVIAQKGPELFDLARKNNVSLLFEGAVAGGIPIVLPLKRSLAANKIQQIAGILNGTTNYILTRMEQANLDFNSALKEAQQKGFAEADPTADVEGHDAACKIGILASIAYQQAIQQDAIFTEGIANIGSQDIEMAKTFGYAIRLIALAKATPHAAIDLRVHPMLVPQDHPLSKIMFENNAIWIQGDAVGDVMFYGKGAGELPTASSVVSDILLISEALEHGQPYVPGMQFETTQTGIISPISETENAYYIRLETEDSPGVIGNLGNACGDHQVSLDAIMQKGTDPQKGTATIVLLTHKVHESMMQAALKEIAAQASTRQVHTVLRVFQP